MAEGSSSGEGIIVDLHQQDGAQQVGIIVDLQQLSAADLPSLLNTVRETLATHTDWTPMLQEGSDTDIPVDSTVLSSMRAVEQALDNMERVADRVAAEQSAPTAEGA